MNKYAIDEEKRFFKFLGVEYPYRPPKPKWEKSSNAEKILCISDPHVPFDSIEVKREVEQKHKDASIVIVPGDLCDFYSKSRFRKTHIVHFNEELKSALYYMEWLSTNWRDVRIMIGNHDPRPHKLMADKIDGETEMLILTESNIIKKLAAYFPNIKVVGTQLIGNDNRDIDITHIYQHGDIIFTHGELSREQDSAVLSRISAQLHKWQKTLRLRPYSVIAQGHNHSDVKMSKGTEKWFGLPTASDPLSIGMEYMLTGNTRMMGSPACIGYSIFYQRNGKTDYNRSHNYLVQ